jgi:hypothetical protein
MKKNKKVKKITKIERETPVFSEEEDNADGDGDGEVVAETALEVDDDDGGTIETELDTLCTCTVSSNVPPTGGIVGV